MDEFKTAIDLTAMERYEYFIDNILVTGEVWGLYEKGWVMAMDDDNTECMPFWPGKDFAEYCAVDEWEGAEPKMIQLEEFINKWMPLLEKDHVKPSIFPNNVDSAIMAPADVLNDIEEVDEDDADN